MTLIMARSEGMHAAHSDDSLYGYTGGLLENEFVPKCRRDVIWRPGMPYVPMARAIAMAKAGQPDGWDPSEPSYLMCPRGSNLHSAVAEKVSPEDWSEVKLYSASGTALDWLHKVDGFFECRGNAVKCDFKLRDGMGGGGRHDVMQIHVYDGSESELDSYAREIAHYLAPMHDMAAA